MQLHCAYQSIANPLDINGNSRKNQDNILIQNNKQTIYRSKGDKHKEKKTLSNVQRLAILDGVGSLPYSEQLTVAVCEALSELPKGMILKELINKITDIHHQQQSIYNAKIKTAGTTLTMLDFNDDGKASLIHIGDSRLYEISPTHVECLTIDANKPNQHAIDQNNRLEINSTTSNEISHCFALGNGYKDQIRKSTSYNELRFLTKEILPKKLRCYEDTRYLTLSKNNYYLLATDGFFTLPNSQIFISSWSSILYSDKYKTLNQKLDMLFHKISQQLITEGKISADNATAILFNVN